MDQLDVQCGTELREPERFLGIYQRGHSEELRCRNRRVGRCQSDHQARTPSLDGRGDRRQGLRLQFGQLFLCCYGLSLPQCVVHETVGDGKGDQRA